MAVEQTTVQTKPQSLIINLLTLEFGTTTLRYASSEYDFVDTFTWVAHPSMKISAKLQTGGAKNETFSILMGRAAPWINVLTGIPHIDIVATIEEVDPADASTRRVLFKGEVGQVKGNEDDKTDKVRITVNGIRAKFEIPFGLPALNSCAWNFGDKSCAIDVVAETHSSVTIVSADGLLITLGTSIAVPRLTKGFLRKDGLLIMIRIQLNTRQVLVVEPIPTSWIGTPVDAVPGCDKQLGTCSGVWDNLSQHGGFGQKIPAYHPVIEES